MASRKQAKTQYSRTTAPTGGAVFKKEGAIQWLTQQYAEGQPASTAGRLSAKRGHGGLMFADLRDASGKIQICVKQDEVGGQTFAEFGTLNLGDIVGVTGTFFKTKTGEVTVQVAMFTLLAKAQRTLPEKWHGLKDVEIRYRKRYLDLIANEPVRRVFLQRARLLSSLRATLDREGFIEVETPMMHAMPGGAAGDPFVTHHKALDTDLYLRLAPELDLKKLLVGGLDRVYELNRSFRNEGVSTRHNPEFTMLEAYAAYRDVTFMMELVQQLICDAAHTLLGTLKVPWQGKVLDLTPPWDRVSFAGTMEQLGLAPGMSLKDMQTVLEKHTMHVSGCSRSQMVRMVEQLFDPKTRTKPLFVVDYWTDLSPLAKAKPDNPALCERFELYLGGLEIANAYSELNDPVEQRKRFEAQVEGQKKKQIDESFLEALEYGMPPATGIGVGIDRLAMLLLDQPSIKDVILFPLLKPEAARG